MIKKLQLTKESVIISAILLLAAFLRLYNINGFLVFLGDEGRDVLTAYNILHGHLTLLGPTSSVGGFFLGPFYYYLIAPFLLLFNYDPVGPAVMIAFFGILTVYFVYKITNEFFGKPAGLFASALYAVSPLVIQYSQSSWNPNLMPIATLILLYLLYKSVNNRKQKYFFIVGLLYGICMQLHYLEVFVGVVILLYTAFGIYKLNPSKSKNIRMILQSYVSIFVGFIISFSPFLLFEVRHNFLNTRNIIMFIFASKDAGPGGNYVTIVFTVLFRLFARLMVDFPLAQDLKLYSITILIIWGAVGVLIGIFSIFALFKIKNKQMFYLLLFWLFISILLFGFYKKQIYDYYFEFLYPLPFMLFGGGLALLYKNAKQNPVKKSIILIIFFLLFLFSLYRADPIFKQANHQKDQAKTIADFVLSKTDNKPFNFALITGGNSDYAYRYYFTIENHPPVTILNPSQDPMRKSVTSQLLVVCESLPCSPLGYSLWEVAGFGRANIVGSWNVSVVKVYKLDHYTGY